jgi:hypothetical protein
MTEFLAWTGITVVHLWLVNSQQISQIIHPAYLLWNQSPRRIRAAM